MKQDNSLFFHVYDTAVLSLAEKLHPKHGSLKLEYIVRSALNGLLSYNTASLEHPVRSERTYSYKLSRLKILYALSDLNSVKDILVDVQPPVPLEKWDAMGSLIYIENSKFSEKYPELIQIMPYEFVDMLRVTPSVFKDMRDLSLLVKEYRDHCESVDPTIAAAFDLHLVEHLYHMVQGCYRGV